MSDLLPVQFRGVDQAADPKAQPPGTIVRAVNCAMDKARRLIKRDGTDGLTKATFDSGVAGASLSTANHLLTRGKDLSLVDNEFARTFSEERNTWQKVGRPPNLRMTRRGLVDTSRSVTQLDTVAYGNLLVTAFVSGLTNSTSPNLFIQVEDIETGTKVMPPKVANLTNAAAYPRLNVLGTKVYFSCSDSAGNICVGYLDMTTLTITNAIAVAGTAAAYAPCDSVIANLDGVNTYLLVAYAVAAGTNRLGVLFITPALVVGTASYTTASQTPIAVCIAASSTHVHIGYVKTSGVNLLTLNAGLFVSTGPTGIAIGSLGTTLTRAFIDMVVDGTELLVALAGSELTGTYATRLRTSRFSLTTHAETAGAGRITFHVISMSRPFAIGTRWYIHATVAPKDIALTTNTSIPNASSCILEVSSGASTLTSVTDSPHEQVGTAESLTGWKPMRDDCVPQVVVLSGVAYVPAAYRNREPVNFQSIPIGWNLHRLELATNPGKLAVVGQGGLCAGASPYWFDGSTVFPYGFAVAPMITAVTVAAGGAQAAGIYTYVAVYEWRDANGILHRSPPSPPRAATLAALDKATVTVSTASLAQHQLPPYSTGGGVVANPVTIAIYRTTVDGSVYYRLTLEPEYQVLVSDPTAGVVSVVDTKADADIGTGSPARTLATQPQLYSSSELDDVPPPALITVVTHRGRLAGIDGSLRTVWLSKDQTQDPMIAPGFNEALTLAFASDKTALASLDEKLVVFGETTIDVVHGDGPDATGAGAWTIQGIQTDVGCVDALSAVTGPMGVMFRSLRGFELLSRDLTVSWVGKAVEDELAAYPTVTSAVLVAAKHEIRYTCTAEDGLTGVVLAWDYFHGIWFVRQYTDTSDTAAASIPFVDAALVDGAYTLLTAAGQVYQETSEHHFDGRSTGDYVDRDVELAWLSPSGSPMAWHRVKDVALLGTSVSNHDLEISIARDYATTYEQTKTFAAPSDATAIGPLERCRVTLMNQKCRAVRVRLRETTPSSGAVGLGAGAIWEGLALRVQTKDGHAKTSSGRQG